MAGKPQTKSLFKVPESNETVDTEVTSKKSEVAKIDGYRQFIKETKGYEPSYSDIFNQGAALMIERDPAYKIHLEDQKANASKSSAKANKPTKTAEPEPFALASA